MDPITNPFAPGAGTRPPELAGRDELREEVRVAVARARLCLPTKSILMVGLRGVGKTVLLGAMHDDARASGLQTLHIEAPEHRYSWDAAASSPITEHDVEVASVTAVAALDESFFRVRFDRLTPAEKRYLRAMAELGPGPHRSGDIADMLGRKVTALGPARAKLISKGMVWSPNHGDTAFTVPLFDEFMRRAIPGDEWKG